VNDIWAFFDFLEDNDSRSKMDTINVLLNIPWDYGGVRVEIACNAAATETERAAFMRKAAAQVSRELNRLGCGWQGPRGDSGETEMPDWLSDAL
jgi:hypothetical protein